jgi:hypothetical protein
VYVCVRALNLILYLHLQDFQTHCSRSAYALYVWHPSIADCFLDAGTGVGLGSMGEAGMENSGDNKGMRKTMTAMKATTGTGTGRAAYPL